MKYLFLLILQGAFFMLAGQQTSVRAVSSSSSQSISSSSSQSVTERASDEGYYFSVKLDRRQRTRLLSAFETVAGYALTVKVTGLIVEQYDNGLVLELNTRRNKLSVNYGGKNEETFAEARVMAGRIKEVLTIAPATAPNE